MWPGQQPPGGEQNPQNPNPYQQPGYHQPNPYQQPGYHQPNPYQQPQQPQQGQPQGPPQAQPQGPPQQGYPQQAQAHDMPTQAWGSPAVQHGAPEPPRKKNRTAVIAVVAAVAVVAAAAVTAVLVTNEDDGGKEEAKGGKKPSAAASSSSPAKGDEGGDDSSGDSSGEDNPRAGQTVEPVVPGWKTVINPKRHNAFDVPAGWYVASPDTMSSYSKDGKPIISMTGPAYYKRDRCTVKDKKTGFTTSSPLAGAGTKGAQGAKTQAQAAKTEALNWLYAVFDQDETGDFKYTTPKKFTSEYGVKGYSSSATVTGVKKTDKCSSDGKAFTVTYTDVNGDWATWVLYSAKGVKDEISDETIKKIMNTLRPLKSGS
ncbi:hypothetical protein ABZ553_34540 [Streptomyces sparsogenes]|uniref:hypothetical protein n=1 Tax=Streptomyces sparsogenes TaxID=67365 RepID=UPI00340C4FAB